MTLTMYLYWWGRYIFIIFAGITYSWRFMVIGLLQFMSPRQNVGRLMTKPTYWYVCPAKTRVSLGICPVWSESLLCAQWVAKDPSFLHADSEDSDQTGRMPRLILVFAGCTCHFVDFVTRWLIWANIRSFGLLEPILMAVSHLFPIRKKRIRKWEGCLLEGVFIRVDTVLQIRTAINTYVGFLKYSDL